jgi:NAD(P)-dependent dehydrogenase (short-subunit alcohol dehydrogenase family)
VDDVAGLFFQTPRARLNRLLGSGSPSPLEGRTTLVTGASSGIGEATVRAVAAKGSTVLLVARRADELERLRGEIVAAGGAAAAYPCDLADGEAVDALVKQVLQDHGAVDYLVNNAGRSIRRSLHLSYDRFHDFERTMAINYFAPVPQWDRRVQRRGAEEHQRREHPVGCDHAGQRLEDQLGRGHADGERGRGQRRGAADGRWRC